MNTAIFILIIFMGDSKGSVTSMEFADEASCNYGRSHIPEVQYTRVVSVCVPKQLKR